MKKEVTEQNAEQQAVIGIIDAGMLCVQKRWFCWGIFSAKINSTPASIRPRLQRLIDGSISERL